MHQGSYYDNVFAIEMKNKIPSSDVGFSVDVISCDIINVKTFREILKYFF